ncbi:GAF domain-containing hybrid sensor histidine kinase/response regulator [Lyngbya sp. PCC 8106]|uniref:hybrid sensor histidine kinase/response regulator n=1 Tax=Lyngbya sp. (strain PCC 8106) TaxID=313612 RepID=UPI0000EAA539|nr:GAF domain-containing hybrid sensor histidine kinase/response regulator [Lyngbya sp. PCC 8106]EAW35351.1 two-component sensor kinase [Lyngbya sp. PCC 8106]
MDKALDQQLEQERLLNQVTSQIRQSLELSIILSTTVEQLQQFLQVDRLLIYQFDFQWSIPSRECSLKPRLDLEEQNRDTRLTPPLPKDSSRSKPSEKGYKGCVTYEARSSENILSVLHLNETDSCFFDTPKAQAQTQNSQALLMIQDVDQAYVDSPCFLEFLHQIQVRSKIVFSIVVQDQLWGLLIAHQCSQLRSWTDSETKFIAKITEHLSIAIYQAQLHTQLQQQKYTLERRVTERTQALHDALLAAQSANRAKSEFLATMSHELRTPLTCVIGISATLLRLYSNGAGIKQISREKQQEYLHKIHDSGEHLLELINDILELSEVEAGKTILQISEFSLTKLAQKTLYSFRERAQEHNVLLISDIQVKPDEDLFIADQRRVEKVLFNLLSNAIKFTPESGQVTLRVGVNKNTAIFQIQDTGIGISEEQQPLLFEKFQQLDSSYRRQYSGTGLGLALTKQLVELHGGVIKLTSTENVGSTFTVHIPIQPTPSPNSQQQVKDSAFKTSLPTTSKNNPLGRFILIENDEEIATLICEILTAVGYQVVWLVEGLTALGQIQLLQPIAVIVDMNLPGQDGYEIIHHLKNTKATQQIKILAITTDSEFTPSESVFKTEADDFITKPIQLNQLLKKIMSWNLENSRG